MSEGPIESVLDRTRPGWRARRDRKRSPWNLVNLMLALPLFGLSLYGLGRTAWAFHVLLVPAHAGRFSEFWPEGISPHALVPSALLMVPLGVPAIVAGMIFSNLVMWLIPPARRAMEEEAAGDPEMTFGGANAKLLVWGGLASLVALALSAIGALTLTSMQ